MKPTIRKLPFDEGLIEDFKCGVYFKDIAVKYGHTQTWVMRHARRLGFNRKSPVSNDAIRELVAQGKPVKEPTIRNYMRIDSE